MNVDGFRLAALKLNSLGYGDRAWLLQQFDPDTQHRLRDLMRELDQQGLNVRDAGADSTFEQALQHAMGAAASEAPVDGDAASMQTLNALDTHGVAMVLEAEPDWIVAGIVSLRGWHGAQACLSSLPVERRLRIAKVAETQRLSPAAARQLASILAGIVVRPASSHSEASHHPVRTRTATAPGRFWQGMRRWKP